MAYERIPQSEGIEDFQFPAIPIPHVGQILASQKELALVVLQDARRILKPTDEEKEFDQLQRLGRISLALQSPLFEKGSSVFANIYTAYRRGALSYEVVEDDGRRVVFHCSLDKQERQVQEKFLHRALQLVTSGEPLGASVVEIVNAASRLYDVEKRYHYGSRVFQEMRSIRRATLTAREVL